MNLGLDRLLVNLDHGVVISLYEKEYIQIDPELPLHAPTFLRDLARLLEEREKLSNQ